MQVPPNSTKLSTFRTIYDFSLKFQGRLRARVSWILSASSWCRGHSRCWEDLQVYCGKARRRGEWLAKGPTCRSDKSKITRWHEITEGKPNNKMPRCVNKVNRRNLFVWPNVQKRFNTSRKQKVMSNKLRAGNIIRVSGSKHRFWHWTRRVNGTSISVMGRAGSPRDLTLLVHVFSSNSNLLKRSTEKSLRVRSGIRCCNTSGCRTIKVRLGRTVVWARYVFILIK